MATTERFQFFVVVRKPSMEFDLQRVTVTNELQASLSEMFLTQAEEFIGATCQKRPFCATYKPSKEEVVCIKPFPVPQHLERGAKNPQEFSEIKMSFQSGGPIVKALVAVDDGSRSAGHSRCLAPVIR